MDFIDEIRALASRITKKLEHIKTEEATKTALVMPFISALGYNVFDPTEVVPEFTADVGTKKGEKVDYAILREGTLIILVECKCSTANLDSEHASQLYRYFSVTEARFGVLTNGIVYRFYTDLEEPNKMDSKPFFEFNMLDIHEPLIGELKRFTKSSFDLDDTITAATELKYTKEIKRIFSQQLLSPSEDFVRFFASQVYTGKLVQSVRQQFADFTKQALRQFINEEINARLKSALAPEIAEPIASGERSAAKGESDEDEKPETKAGIVTTEEEIEGFHIVKAILREVVDPKRVVMRDKKNFCGALLDNSNRKPICRLWFNEEQRHLSLFDENKVEEKVPIECLEDIYKYAERLKLKITHYDEIIDKELP